MINFVMSSFEKKGGLRKYIGPKRILLAVVALYAGYIIIGLYNDGLISPEIVLKQQRIHPLRAISLFISFYVISVVFLLPSLPLNLAGGFFWGGFWGGLLSTVGVTLGSWISFYLSRNLVGKILAKRFENKWLNLVQEEFNQNDWKFLAFARLNPVVPTGPLNYILGLTSMSHRSYLIVTFSSLLVPSVAIAFIGDLIQGYVLADSRRAGVIRDVIIASSIVTLLALIKVAVKILKKGSAIK